MCRVIDEDKSKKKGPEEKQPKKQLKKEEEGQKEEEKPRKEPDKKEGKKEVESKRKNLPKPGVTSTSDSEDEDDQEGEKVANSHSKFLAYLPPHMFLYEVFVQQSMERPYLIHFRSVSCKHLRRPHVANLGGNFDLEVTCICLLWL